MIVIAPEDSGETDALMDAEAYAQYCEEEA